MRTLELYCQATIVRLPISRYQNRPNIRKNSKQKKKNNDEKCTHESEFIFQT